MREKKANQRTIRVGSDLLEVVVSGDESRGVVFAARVTIPAGGGPPVMHTHDSFELYRVDQGELSFYLGRGDGGTVERRVAAAGEVVAIPGGQEHTIRNESPHDAHALAVFAPGTDVEPFFRAAAAVDATPETIVALATEHGIEITRPVPGEATS
jgi:mannose-6-phosphate isomerase-like protein (cupin superfamily)